MIASDDSNDVPDYISARAPNFAPCRAPLPAHGRRGMKSSILAQAQSLLPAFTFLGLAFALTLPAAGTPLFPSLAYPTRTASDRQFAAYGGGPFVLADLTGDGWADLAAIDDVRQAVWIYDGSPQGLPQSPTYGIGIPGVLDLAVADLDANGGRVLLAVDGTHVLEFLRVGGNWTLSVALTAQSARAIATGDFDHDGRTDLALLGTTGASVWFHQEGPQAFTANASMLLSPGVPFQSLVVGDLDGDGRDDLALAKPYEIHVFLQGPQGLLLQSLDFTTRSTGGLVSLAILPAMGLQYLVEANAGTEAYVGLWRWNGVSFDNTATISGAFGTGLATGDANDDHQSDLAVVGVDGSVQIFLQRGAIFSPPSRKQLGGERSG